MKQYVIFLSVVFLIFMAVSSNAQDRFDRSAVIYADTLDNGGFGNIVAGVDYDNDGLEDMYAVNNNWNDTPGYEQIPRIYKYEKNAQGKWNIVWSTRLPLNFQNTWPALVSADLDNDGKWEIVWGPVNNEGSGLQPNPVRIYVYESPGDATDNMGVQNPDGTWRPNAQWTISTLPTWVDIRPVKWIPYDLDSDGTTELVTSCRAGDALQVYSVNNVPDAADSTETWTLEFTSGTAVTGIYYDIFILNNRAYGIRDNGTVTPLYWDGAAYVLGTPQTGLAGGGSWKSSQVVDVDYNAVNEVLVASWSSGNNDIYLLQELSPGVLTATMIGAVPSTSGRCYGGAAGDLDNDTYLDYVWGTRGSTPLGIIHRLEYQGGAINDPNSWSLSIIDQQISLGQQYDQVFAKDLDGDDKDEVIYSGTPRGLTATDTPQPIVVLEQIDANQPIVAAVADVPNDQGRQVWVIWQGAGDDVLEGNIPVAIYGPKVTEFPEIYINGQLLVPITGTTPLNTEQITQYVVWRIDAGQYPVQLATVVPIQAPYYAAVVPTLGDGTEWLTDFIVSAHTPDPYLNWKSFPKSGYSVDNLVPMAPTNFTGNPVGGNVELAWDESPDPDFNYFSIRRGTQPGFDPTNPATEIGTTTANTYLDPNVGVGNFFYRVVAYDFNANQGEFSNEVLVVLTKIGEVNAIPKEFALKQNYPNPFNPETWIAFDLPQAVNVTVVIYNTLGQKVRTLVNEPTAAGSYKILWNGTNDQGNNVASGVYVYTIKAGTFTEAKKMTLMR